MCYSHSFCLWGEGNRELQSGVVRGLLHVRWPMQGCTIVCVGLHPLCRQVFFSLSLVQLMNNDLIVDCGVKCQLSVCLYVTCHFDRSGFPPLFYSLSICSFDGIYMFSMQQLSTAGTIKKFIDHFHFSCCAADINIWSNYSCFHCNDILICAYLYFSNALCTVKGIIFLVNH